MCLASQMSLYVGWFMLHRLTIKLHKLFSLAVTQVTRW